jgi:UDP-glucose-4-epimerase GalE
MREEDVDRLVFSSSCATYGVPAANPIGEDARQAPVNPYGRSKLMAELILKDLAAKGAVNCVALRYFNAAGADAAGEIGEEHDPETHLIPLVLGAARGSSRPLEVYGSDHPTPDGTCIRDYVHVTDMADAHVRALVHAGRHGGFTAFNLGTGSGFSVKQILAMAEEVTGRKVPHVYGPRRAGDPAELVADPRLARDKLGWTAQHSGLRNMLQTAWSWMQRNG